MKTVYLRISVALVLMVIIGCGGSSEPEPTPIPAPTPTPVNVTDLLLRSGEATGSLSTFFFKLEHNRGGGTPLTETLVVTEAEGKIVSPDGIETDFAGTLGNFAVRSSLITLGEASYMTNPITGLWEEVPKEVSPLGFFDPKRGIGAMMVDLQSPVLVSTSEFVYRVDGVLDVDALQPLLGSATDGTTVDVQLTIDAETLFLERAVIEGRVTATEPDGVVRTISLSKFNDPISINPPG